MVQRRDFLTYSEPNYGIGTIGTVLRAYEGKGAYEKNWEMGIGKGVD